MGGRVINRLQEELAKWGCDMVGAMERFLQDEEFYRACLQEVVADSAFSTLGAALKEQDAKRAFECAHMLKGVVGNLGLTPLYEQTVKLVEPLRQGDCRGLWPVYETLLKMNEKLKALLLQV